MLHLDKYFKVVLHYTCCCSYLGFFVKACTKYFWWTIWIYFINRLHDSPSRTLRRLTEAPAASQPSVICIHKFIRYGVGM
ncbi:unnamed protein product, partial [Iphiclides podalirius]